MNNQQNCYLVTALTAEEAARSLSDMADKLMEEERVFKDAEEKYTIRDALKNKGKTKPSTKPPRARITQRGQNR